MAASLRYGLFAILTGQALQQSTGIITEDAYFYGQSPPSYPSPNATGTGAWADANVKAKALVSQLTVDEKVSLTGGVSSGTGCSGSIPAIASVNFPGLCLSDAGNGLRSTDYVTAWASGWSVGASWNRALARQRAVGMGGEFRKKGSNIALGPVVGPLGRLATSGRNWEGYASDPYLSGQLAYETVLGLQSEGIIASVKHYIGNEQETNRSPDGNISSLSSNIDDATIHELYLWPFADAVHAGAGSIMCSYNRVNNSYACGNSYTLNHLLKTELGFEGFVVSDWEGQHSGVATALAGLDMTMPSGSEFWGDNLALAVSNGSVNVARLDDMATRIVAAWYQMGQDSDDFASPGHGIPRDLSQPHTRVIGWNSSFKDVVYRGALEGHVLVKNTNNALPLKSPELLSIFGYSAKAADVFGISNPNWHVGAYPVDVPGYAFGLASLPPIAINGTVITGGGSGANEPAYISSPFEALSVRAAEDSTALYWDFRSTNPAIDASTDACIVVVNTFAAEGYDREALYDDYTDGLILNVAARCSNTIVVFHNPGARLVDTFVDHPNVTALIFAHTPGQDSGKALVNLLYGDENFSGKLPYTLPKNESDYAGLDQPSLPEGEFVLFPQSNFTEGVYVDYRSFDARNVTPRYEFGFGLSYTTFAFSELSVALNTGADTDEYPVGPVAEGGQTDLWDVVAVVNATVANTGAVAGAEVAQVYVGIPGAPVRQLRGFVKPVLGAGESVNVGFELTRRDLSVWDAVAQKWLLQSGSYTVSVGSSSRDLPLVGTLVI